MQYTLRYFLKTLKEILTVFYWTNIELRNCEKQQEQISWNIKLKCRIPFYNPYTTADLHSSNKYVWLEAISVFALKNLKLIV